MASESQVRPVKPRLSNGEGGEIARQQSREVLAPLYLQFTDGRKEATLKGRNAMQRLPWKDGVSLEIYRGWIVVGLEGGNKETT